MKLGKPLGPSEGLLSTEYQEYKIAAGSLGKVIWYGPLYDSLSVSLEASLGALRRELSWQIKKIAAGGWETLDPPPGQVFWV